MTTVLVTGGTGFVGRPTVERLVARGHDVHLVARSRPPVDGTTVHHVDLLQPGALEPLCRSVRASHLLHLAWYAEPGRFWNDASMNLQWVEASLRLARAFAAAGGTRIVGLGTAAESPDSPTASIYATSKGSVHALLGRAMPSLGTTLAWARLHQPYGPGEHPARLVPAATRALREGQAFRTATNGLQRRDFVHVRDVAAALVALLEIADGGCFDIGTGSGTTVREVVLGIARRLGAEEHVAFGTDPLPAHEPIELLADTSALSAIGWRPSVSLEQGLDEAIGSTS